MKFEAQKQFMLASANTSQYYDLSPAELQQRYLDSAAFITKSSSKLDTQEYYEIFAQHFHLCLLTHHDNLAKAVLQRLTDRFGEDSSRITVLKSLYLEACDGGPKAAMDLLSSRPESDFNALKRKIALLKSADTEMYVQELLNFLTICPLDAEAWAELASVYISLGKLHEAIHALQEVVISCPKAYNNFALLGDVYFQIALPYEKHTSSSARENYKTNLELALKHYARSAELCPNYLRAWAGIFATCSKLDNSAYASKARKQLEKLISSSKNSEMRSAAEKVLKHYSTA